MPFRSNKIIEVTVTEKKCSKCGIVRLAVEFHKSAFQKSGLECSCKLCNKIGGAAYYDLNRETILERNREAYARSPLKYRQTRNQWNKRNYLKEKAKKDANRDHINAVHREWKKKNRNRLNSEYKERYKNDIAFHISEKCRHRIKDAIQRCRKGTMKCDRTIKLLGCSYNELKKYIEEKFTDGMSWDRVIAGKIHLDHIRPICTFDLLDQEQQRIAFHYTNLQPLWARDNLRKARSLKEAI